jgi:hypothetical protein
MNQMHDSDTKKGCHNNHIHIVLPHLTFMVSTYYYSSVSAHAQLALRTIARMCQDAARNVSTCIYMDIPRIVDVDQDINHKKKPYYSKSRGAVDTCHIFFLHAQHHTTVLIGGLPFRFQCTVCKMSVTAHGTTHRFETSQEPNVLRRPFHVQLNHDTPFSSGTSIGFCEWLPHAQRLDC